MQVSMDRHQAHSKAVESSQHQDQIKRGPATATRARQTPCKVSHREGSSAHDIASVPVLSPMHRALAHTRSIHISTFIHFVCQQHAGVRISIHHPRGNAAATKHPTPGSRRSHSRVARPRMTTTCCALLLVHATTHRGGAFPLRWRPLLPRLQALCHGFDSRSVALAQALVGLSIRGRLPAVASMAPAAVSRSGPGVGRGLCRCGSFATGSFATARTVVLVAAIVSTNTGTINTNTSASVSAVTPPSGSSCCVHGVTVLS
mgnify:CR=1 FL=1